MILPTKITIEDLSKFGKAYKWEKYDCEKCERPMWGHGFVMRYFAEALAQIPLKRYRCPDCSRVVTTRPETHWAGIRSSVSAIYLALMAKLKGGWPAGFPRQRGLHWLSRFVAFSQMENKDCLPSFLEHCFAKQIRFFH